MLAHRFSIVLAAVAAIAPALAGATTLSVPSGSYPTIASALAAANASDVIEVSAGTYSEAAMLSVTDDNLTIRAVGGVVTINAPSSADSVIEVLANGVVFEGLTITRPTADTDWRRSVQVGGGSLTLTNCDIQGPGNSVGVILFHGTDLTATGTTFGNFNSSAGWAAAIFMQGSLGDYTNVVLDNCTFTSGCTGWIKTFGGDVPKVGNISVTNCEFQAATGSQAIFFAPNTVYDPTATLTFEDCQFTGTNLETAEFHYTSAGGPASLAFRRCVFNAYNGNRRVMYVDIPCPITFENVAWLGGQHETLIRFWGGPADVTFNHCTLVNDGVSSATSASGTDQSTLIDGWDGGGRTFTLRNCLLYTPASYTAAIVGDPGSGASRVYDIDYTIIDSGAATSSGPVSLMAGGNFSDTATILFVNPAVHDFEPQLSSPGVDEGTDLGITTDVLGRTRPSGSNPDFGAYEVQQGSAVINWEMF